MLARLARWFAPVAVAALALACQGADAKPQGFGPMPVQLLKLEQHPIADYDEYLASLTSRHSLTLYPQVTGYIRSIKVKPGTQVKKGALLVEIDPGQQAATLRSLMASLATRKANLDYAVKNEESSRELVKAGVLSQLDYQQRSAARSAAEAEVKAGQAQVQAQAELLDFYRIEAPSDGVTGDVPVKVGDYVTPQTRLTSVDDNNLVEAYVYIPVSKLGAITPETTVALLDEQGKAGCDEKPTFVSKEVNVETQSVLIKTACPNLGQLRTSQVLKARVIWSRRPGVSVPTASVTRLAGQYFVFVAQQTDKGLVAHQVPIAVGSIQDNDYVVEKGLEPGMQIVTTNLQKIREGAPIAAAPPPQPSASAEHPASPASSASTKSP